MAALQRASARGALGPPLQGLWSFFDSYEGVALYQEQRGRFASIYDCFGRKPEGDRQVRRLFNAAGPPPGAARLPRRPAARPQPKSEASPGGLLDVSVGSIRFAHDAQSEQFGRGPSHGADSGCILQLAAELLAGITAPEDVPMFSVCRHQARWFCRSGNRRLAALRLAHHFMPERLRQLRVQAVETDEAFLHGTQGRRPKLTTHRNDVHGAEPCLGRWIRVSETGEFIGCERPGGEDEHGADLLALLPTAADPPSAPSAPRGSVGSLVGASEGVA